MTVAQRFERPIKRRTDISVGDLIQYLYRWYGCGVSQQSLTTREVVEVIDGGAKFIVQGGYSINATQIQAHIPMHRAIATDAMKSVPPAIAGGSIGEDTQQ